MAKGLGFYNSDYFKFKEGKDLVYENIIRILMTGENERVMRPSFGAGLNKSIFSLITPDKMQDLAIAIHSKIQYYENKVIVKDVQTSLTEDETAIKIHVFMEYVEKQDETNKVLDELVLNYSL